jgi:hypothetical protein
MEKRGLLMRDNNSNYRIRVILIVLSMFIIMIARPNSVAKAYDKNDFEIYEDSGELHLYTGDETNVIVPEGVTSIGENAFQGCTHIESITLPEGITSIGQWAFSNCTR